MTVYILLEDTHGETSDVVGVFASLADAQAYGARALLCDALTWEGTGPWRTDFQTPIWKGGYRVDWLRIEEEEVQ